MKGAVATPERVLNGPPAHEPAVHHPQLASRFADLAATLEELQHATPPVDESRDALVPSLLLDLLASDTAPTWAQAQSLLERCFGTADAPRSEWVSEGFARYKAIAAVLRRAVDFEENLVALKLWLSGSDHAAMLALRAVKSSINPALPSASANHLAQPAQQATPPTFEAADVKREVPAPMPSTSTSGPVPEISGSNGGTGQDHAPSLPPREGIKPRMSRSSPAATAPSAAAKGKARAATDDDAPVEQQGPTPGTSGLSPAQKRAPSALASEMLVLSETDEASSEEEAQPPAKRRCLRSGGARAEDPRAVKAERGTPKNPQAGGKTPPPPPVGNGLSWDGTIRTTGSASTVDAVAALLDLPFLPLEQDGEPLLRGDVPTIAPPPHLAVPQDRSLSFCRPHLGNNPQVDVNPGTRKVNGRLEYAPRGMNLCGLAGGRAVAPGEPLVFFSERARCAAVLAAASTALHPDKDREGMNVLVCEGENRWVYKGVYAPVRAASVFLPVGEGAEDRLDPSLKRILQTHCGAFRALPRWSAAEKKKERKTDAKWPARVLKDWGFASATTYDEAVAELVKNGDETQAVMHCVVFRCVGWDAESFEEWAKRRQGGGKKGK